MTKSINLYSIYFLFIFSFKEPEPHIFGGSGFGFCFFLNRLWLRLLGVKNNRLQLPSPGFHSSKRYLCSIYVDDMISMGCKQSCRNLRERWNAKYILHRFVCQFSHIFSDNYFILFRVTRRLDGSSCSTESPNVKDTKIRSGESRPACDKPDSNPNCDMNLTYQKLYEAGRNLRPLVVQEEVTDPLQDTPALPVEPAYTVHGPTKPNQGSRPGETSTIQPNPGERSRLLPNPSRCRSEEMVLSSSLQHDHNSYQVDKWYYIIMYRINETVLLYVF